MRRTTVESDTLHGSATRAGRRPRCGPRVGLAAFGAGVVAVVAGCMVPIGGPVGGPSAVRPGDPGGPFAPVALLLHPLTHDDLDDDGRPVLIVHVELRDRWGDPVKGAGSLRLVVFRDDPTLGTEGEALAWTIDLRDLSLNARLYDPTTKTYRMTLEDIGPVLAAAGGPGARLRLGAVMQAADPAGGARILRDTREVVIGG